MSKHETAEARVLRYFQQAPLGEAELVLGLAKSAVKQRQPVKPAAKPKKQKQVIPGVLREGDGGQTTPF